MGRITVEACVCERCGHIWIPKSLRHGPKSAAAATKSSENEIVLEEPIVCPKCRSPYWNKPRRGKGMQKQQQPQQQKKQQAGKKSTGTTAKSRSASS